MNLADFYYRYKQINNLVDPVNKFGLNANATTGAAVWDGNSDYTFPSSAVSLEVVSTSADDTATSGGGTGARTILVSGLDANYKQQTEMVSLNGTGAVAMQNQFLRVNRAYVLTAGTSAGQAGDILIRGTGGGTTYAKITYTFALQSGNQTTQFNQTNQAVYTVPSMVGMDETKGILGVYEIEPAKPSGVTAVLVTSLRIREPGGVFRARHTDVISSERPSTKEFWGIVLPGGTDVMAKIDYVSAAGVTVNASFDLLVVKAGTV